MPALGAAPQGRTRKFRLRYEAHTESVRANLWLPLPQTSPFQKVESLKITAPAHRKTRDERGNQMLFVPGNEASLECKVTRREQTRPEKPVEEDHVVIYSHLAPERLVPIDQTIRAWAGAVVRGAATDLEKARAIYNHVVATVKYDKSGKGWGRGDIYYACNARRGNCTDFHAIFIGYCRAVNVPARFVIGLPLPADRHEGRIEGYHCWAECYVKGAGWMPVDASEAAKDPSRREYFFGTIDEHRVEFSRGRDLTLAPPQSGAPLNFFAYPYAEVEGQPVETKVEVSFEDLS